MGYVVEEGWDDVRERKEGGEQKDWSSTPGPGRKGRENVYMRDEKDFVWIGSKLQEGVCRRQYKNLFRVSRESVPSPVPRLINIQL